LHVGDDVVASTGDVSTAEICMQKVLDSKLNMQVLKQGFGCECAEFLRISYNSDLAVAYFPRSVASAVSGSWVNERLLGLDEYISSIMQQVWTWRQRAQMECVTQLWCTTLVRRLGLTVAEAMGVCGGSTSINGSPFWGYGRKTGTALRVETKRAGSSTVKKTVRGVKLPRRSTEDYKKYDPEHWQLVRLGVPVKVLDEVMLEASYGNFFDRPPNVGVSKRWAKVNYGSVKYRSIGKVLTVGRGIKQAGFLASLLKGKISDDLWRAYSAATRVDVRQYLSTHSKKMSCFGYGTPYSEAMEAQQVLELGSVYYQQYLVLI